MPTTRMEGAEPLQDPLRRAPAGAVAEEMDDVGHPAGLSGMALGDPGEALGEDALGKGMMAESQAHRTPYDRHHHALQRQALEQPQVVLCRDVERVP